MFLSTWWMSCCPGCVEDCWLSEPPRRKWPWITLNRDSTSCSVKAAMSPLGATGSGSRGGRWLGRGQGQGRGRQEGMKMTKTMTRTGTRTLPLLILPILHDLLEHLPLLFIQLVHAGLSTLARLALTSLSGVQDLTEGQWQWTPLYRDSWWNSIGPRGARTDSSLFFCLLLGGGEAEEVLQLIGQTTNVKCWILRDWTTGRGDCQKSYMSNLVLWLLIWLFLLLLGHT